MTTSTVAIIVELGNLNRAPSWSLCRGKLWYYICLRVVSSRYSRDDKVFESVSEAMRLGQLRVSEDFGSFDL
ncbi:hypothetical protein B296_00010745 [Ensete ventricosum]|uniref:Uncharacterized protein n=1 Tax=Ensete ventricosum TaxID=4639 RepID=A0A427AHL0_ENSVE|nr:hypothetical protein B296_00010745 [Ensete ventricosum]